MELLKGNFLINTNEESVIANDVIRGSDYVGLYFSASWCPPCQTFLPLLKNLHEEARSRGIKLEIVFVSSDVDNQRMTRFFVDNHGPWFAVDAGPLAVALRKKLQIYAIPQLVIFNNKGKVISKDGRAELENNDDPFSLWFPELNSDVADRQSDD